MNSLALILLVVLAVALWLSGGSVPDLRQIRQILRAASPESVALLALAVFSVLALSFVCTWLVWESQISEIAFHCTDQGCLSEGFWMSLETHKVAGDQIMPEWSWEKLAVVRRLYQGAFFMLSLVGIVAAFRMWKSDTKSCEQTA